MKNGIQSINLKTLNIIILLFFLISISNANEIQISPLIKLDEISPSFEDIDEENIPQKKRDGIEKEIDSGDTDLKFVSLSVLNKVTARVDIVGVLIKENFIYEDMRLYPIHCNVSDPNQKPETSVYLKIYSNTESKVLFSGWMLKTLPSISSLEHPLYDIWVNGCD